MERIEDLDKEISVRVEKIENTIDHLLSKTDSDFAKLVDASRYATLGGGKRIRGFLTTEFARIGGSLKDSVYVYAALIEMIHAASLIHDDMPCMDDDDMRRGKPSTHIAYGDATALLAGDALFVYPYEVISGLSDVSDTEKVEIIKIFSKASGLYGMMGGQQMDILSLADSEEKLIKLQSLKTGRMIRAACLAGCVASGHFLGSELYACAEKYADCLGLAFQITDDLLDVTGSPEILGKNIGMDAKNSTVTFANIMPYEEAFDRAAQYTATACAQAEKFGKDQYLSALAKSLLLRKS